MLFLLTNPVTRPLQLLLEYLNRVAASLPLPEWLSSWAVAIIAIAVIVKVVTQPLTSRQQGSMKKMQALQPKLSELQKRYKDDREKLAQAQMELYKTEGVNPFGGCLPLIVQMVVLIGLWRAIMTLAGTEANPGQMSGARFMWVPDLSICEPSPLCHPELALLPWAIPILLILMVVSQIGYQHYMTPMGKSGDPQQQAMASMTKWMPLLFAYIFIRFPAGVVLYYTTFNAVGLGQVLASRWWSERGKAASSAAALTVSDSVAGPPAAEQEKVHDEPASGDRRRRRRKDR
jgi:YidC/Oxa1 family membrane protein insertase